MMARSFDRPATGGERNCNWCSWQRPSGVWGTVMLANVAPLGSKAITV
jgi:hypothetical protein